MGIYSELNLNQDKATKSQTVQIVRQGEATLYWFKFNPLYLFARVEMTSKGANRFFIFKICLLNRMNKKQDDKKTRCMDIGLTHLF